MPVNKLVGIFGGTFDPVHDGHLQMARDAYDALGLDEVRMVPCHRPPHRDMPVLTSEQRVELLSIALHDCQGLVLDSRELQRMQLSYTVDTLRSFRQELGAEASLVLIMGMDAYGHLTSWHRWQELRQLAHLLVMARPGADVVCEPVLQQWLHESDDVSVIKTKPYGALIRLDCHLIDISSTKIRTLLREGKPVNGVPDSVLKRIQAENWYR